MTEFGEQVAALIAVCKSRAVDIVPSPDRAATAPPTPESGGVPRCLHCGEDLLLDDIWGWMHANSRYLCSDPASGELLCMPATLI